MEIRMYGQINRITAVPGRKDALQRLLLQGMDEMPGCISYIVSEDATDASVLWVVEVWDSERSWKSSLELPVVKDSIREAMPMIAAFDSVATMRPVGCTVRPMPVGFC